LINPATVVDYNRLIGHVENADRMVNRYKASRRTFKWTKMVFFHILVDMATVKKYILLSSSGGKKVSHRFLSHPYPRDAGTVWA
jgi:hypothetical protein